MNKKSKYQLKKITLQVSLAIYGAMIVGPAFAQVATATNLGNGSTAADDGSTAVGSNSKAIGVGSNTNYTIVNGQPPVIKSNGSTAYGDYSTATNGGTAVGSGATASNNDVAIGSSTTAGNGSAGQATAVGSFSSAADQSTAIGYNAQTFGANGTALGNNSQAGATGTALGANASAGGANGTSIGFGSSAGANGTTVGSNSASGDNGTAIGQAASAQTRSTAIGAGAGANSTGDSSVGGTSIGANAVANSGSIAIGDNAIAGNAATNLQDIAIGNHTNIIGSGSIGIGSNTTSINTNSVALGNGTATNRDNEVDVGNRTIGQVQAATQNDQAVNLAQLNAALSGISAGTDPLAVDYDSSTFDGITLKGVAGTAIHNVANGVVGTDAMNLSQGSALAAALGGGAAFVNGNLQVPAYNFISGDSFNNVGTALANLDARVASNTTAITNLQNTSGGNTGGNSGPVSSTDNNALHYDNGQGSGSVSLNGGGQIHGVNAGTASTDAANVGQVQDAQSAAVSQSKTYTDTVATQTLTSANNYTNQAVSGFQTQLNGQQGQINDLYGKIGDLKNRINGVGASAMAASSLVPLSNLPGTTQLAAGYGEYGGQSALAVGAFHVAQSGNVIYNLKISAATSGPVGIGAGVTWVWK